MRLPFEFLELQLELPPREDVEWVSKSVHRELLFILLEHSARVATKGPVAARGGVGRCFWSATGLASAVVGSLAFMELVVSRPRSSRRDRGIRRGAITVDGVVDHLIHLVAELTASMLDRFL
ncbi:hypothetical protein L2E82_17034 [Cichorium intybus]|uniref:Uncharacterized protein n=1 Tax=Cichorium intybus TaxID=13427 RepID=A0ACB9F851_CICIN|nr:hypothetical protein L2E82_17034 [Cichorium intybus]